MTQNAKVPLSVGHKMTIRDSKSELMIYKTSKIVWSTADPWTMRVWIAWVHLFFSPNTQHRTIRSAVGWILRQGGPTVKLYVHFNCSGVSLPNPCIAQGSTVLLKLGNIPTQTYFPKSCFWISRPEPLCPLCQSSHSPELASPASPLLIPLRAILWERKGWRIFFLSHHRSIVSGID